MLTMVSGMLCQSICHAGEMGPASMQSPNMVFASLEGSYTWNKISSYSVNSREVDASTKGWGGRIAGGMIHPITDKLRVTGEIGGGYYGRPVLNLPAATGISIESSIDGYDALLGVMYKVSQFDVFGDVGFMAQNFRVKNTINTSLGSPGGLFSGTSTTKSNTTQIFPEIKVGGIYNLDSNWGISLAYMHVFGTTPKSDFIATASSAPPSIVEDGYSYAENPTLDSIFLGIRYSI